MSAKILKNLRISRISAVPDPAVEDSVWLIKKGKGEVSKETPGATGKALLERISDILGSAVEAVNKAINGGTTESTEMDIKTVKLEEILKERPEILDEVLKGNPELLAQIKKDFTKPSPASPNAAQVTPLKPGLAAAQATPPATTIEAQVDAARTQIMTDVREMVTKQVGDVLATVKEMQKTVESIGSLSEISKSIKTQGEAIAKIAEGRTAQAPGQGGKDVDVRKAKGGLFGTALTATRGRARKSEEATE